MAEIKNNATDAAQLAVRIEILEKVAGKGMVSHGPLKLNAERGIARTHVSFWVGDHEIFRNEVLMHKMSVKTWTEEISALIEGRLGPREVNFGLESPELLMTARRSRPMMAGGHPFYELLVVLDAGSFDAGGGISGEGPAMLLTPKAEVLKQFSMDLLREVEEIVQD